MPSPEPQKRKSTPAKKPPPSEHPKGKENDPRAQREYRESTRSALDPHRKDEVKPL